MLSPQNADTSQIIAAYIRERFPTLAFDARIERTPLIGSDVIDSLGILELMTFLNERFGIEAVDEDFEPENFETIGHLAGFVERKRS